MDPQFALVLVIDGKLAPSGTQQAYLNLGRVDFKSDKGKEDLVQAVETILITAQALKQAQQPRGDETMPRPEDIVVVDADENGNRRKRSLADKMRSDVTAPTPEPKKIPKAPKTPKGDTDGVDSNDSTGAVDPGD